MHAPTSRPRALLACLALAWLAPHAAPAAEIRDKGNMFSPRTVREAERSLERIERERGVPVRIETIGSVDDALGAQQQREWASKSTHQRLDLLARQEAAKGGGPGVFVLLSKGDNMISEVLVHRSFQDRFGEQQRTAIRNAFIDQFKQRRFDAGLLAAVVAIDRTLAATPGGARSPATRRSPLPGPRDAGARPAPAPGRVQQPDRVPQKHAGGGFPTWLIAVLVILGIVVFFRVIRGFFGGGGGYAGRPAGAPGGGYAGGYGGGLGGGGGGFFSGMLGGLAGSVLGNWGYDRFARPQSGSSSDPGTPTTDPTSYDPSPDPSPYVGPQGETSPGDWIGGGSDAGGGADWGGGGGDWGGSGGGDWGGGGGGDWGGGGGGGGSDW